VVNALAPGGAAESSGQIKVGDVVVAVCGVSTKDMKPAEVRLEDAKCLHLSSILDVYMRSASLSLELSVSLSFSLSLSLSPSLSSLSHSVSPPFSLSPALSFLPSLSLSLFLSLSCPPNHSLPLPLSLTHKRTQAVDLILAKQRERLDG